MNDFLDTASKLFRAGKVADKKEHFERVFKAISALQAVHSKAQLDLNNIESIFTALEIANTLGKLPGFKVDEIPQTIASLKEVIVVTLEKTIQFPISGPRGEILSPDSYKSFASLLNFLKKESRPSYSVSVISFNYDIALDLAMYRNGFGPVYGFVPHANSVNPVKLLKLHGSLNWAARSDNGAITVLTLEEYFSKYSINNTWGEIETCSIPIGSQLKECYSKVGVEVYPEPVIVPPAWNKADYHQSLSSVWSSAAKELEDAEYIFIMGYSLPETDVFFKLLYGLGTVGEKPLKKLIVYNPDSNVGSRFKQIIGPGALARYEFRQMKFNTAISNVELFFTETGN